MKNCILKRVHNMPGDREVTKKKQAMITRRERVNALYLQGVPQAEIAEQMHVNQAQISRDLKALREIWIERSVTAIGERKAIELAKIDQLELTYWEAWEASKKPKESVTLHRLGNVMAGDIVSTKVNETTRREGQVGDPSFLNGVMSCIDKRCKILGLDAPARNLNIDLSSMTDAQLEKLAAGADIIDVLSGEGE